MIELPQRTIIHNVQHFLAPIFLAFKKSFSHQKTFVSTKNGAFLTRQECTVMKGLAILCIILHNYCHWLPNIVQENEFTCWIWKAEKLLEVITQPDSLLPIHLLSFFGHYGVPVFLFLSGFGMIMKYEKGTIDHVSIWSFVRYNYLKLFRILMVGFVLFVLQDTTTPNPHRYQLCSILTTLSMTSNIFGHPDEIVCPGPYWYFGVTFQLYFIYRLIIYKRHWSIVVGLITICWLFQVAYLDPCEILLRLRYNFVGSMMPFGMGVLAGRYLNKNFTKAFWVVLLLVSFTLSFAFSFNINSWLFIPVFIVTGVIALIKLLPNCIFSQAYWVGSISSSIFIIHPLVRNIFIQKYQSQNIYAGILLYILATLFLSWLINKIINQLPCPKL